MRILTNEQQSALRAFLVAMGVSTPTASAAADAAARAVRDDGLEAIPDVARRHHCSRRLVWKTIQLHNIPYISRGGRFGSLVNGEAIDAALEEVTHHAK